MKITKEQMVKKRRNEEEKWRGWSTTVAFNWVFEGGDQSTYNRQVWSFALHDNLPKYLKKRSKSQQSLLHSLPTYLEIQNIYRHHSNTIITKDHQTKLT